MSDDAETRKAQTTAFFNRLAPEYDLAGCFAHFGQRLVDVAGIEPGQRVLDVASGRGAVLFPTADRLGETGEVVGIDIAEAMARIANEEAARRSSRARVRVMDAERLDFPDASFDRLLCGFGLMFLPRLDRALAEFHRVLAPGGRLAVSTWRQSESWDLLAVLGSQGLLHGPPPGWISEPDVLAGHLTQAGFADVQVGVDVAGFRYADLDAYWQGARGTGVRAMLDGLDAAQAGRVRAALADRLAQYQQPDGYHVPASALLAVARR